MDHCTTPPAAVQPAYLSDRDRFVSTERMLAAVAADGAGNDLEWLESHAALLESIPHEAARLLARSARELVDEMAFLAVTSAEDLDVRRKRDDGRRQRPRRRGRGRRRRRPWLLPHVRGRGLVHAESSARRSPPVTRPDPSLTRPWGSPGPSEATRNMSARNEYIDASDEVRKHHGGLGGGAPIRRLKFSAMEGDRALATPGAVILGAPPARPAR